MSELVKGISIGEVLPISPIEPPCKTLHKDTGTNPVLLIDGDILAYRSSASCEGVYYHVHVPFIKGTKLRDGSMPDTFFKYKKDADKYFKKMKEEEGYHGVTITKKSKPEPESYAIHNVDSMMKTILNEFSSVVPIPCVRIFLTGNTNYRNEIAPDYKKNREGMKRPTHLNTCKQHLINNYHAEIKENYEADDLIGISAMEYRKRDRDYVICTTDKDLKCIPGDHYDFIKDEYEYMTEELSNRFFYKQCLMGDKTDNIPGIKGVGPVRAERFLGESNDKEELYLRCIACWANHTIKENPRAFDGIAISDFLKVITDSFSITAQLVWILREWKGWKAPLELFSVVVDRLEYDRKGDGFAIKT